MVGKQILDTLTSAGSNGVSVDAQIGDRSNTLGNSIGDVRGENVALETGDRAFEGNARDVDITDTDYPWLMIFCIVSGFVGLIVGIFIDKEKIKNAFRLFRD